MKKGSTNIRLFAQLSKSFVHWYYEKNLHTTEYSDEMDV